MADILYEDALQLLQAIGSNTAPADVIMAFMNDCGLSTHRQGNNIWCLNRACDTTKPTILLYAHYNALAAETEACRLMNGELWGQGLNYGGGSLVALMAAFRYYYHKRDLPYNLCFCAAEERESHGVPRLPVIQGQTLKPDFAIVGEPTDMQMAIAEMGHLVLDCVANGKAGHAGRSEGDNAIYHALRDINWFATYEFNKCAAFMPPIRMAVLQVNAGGANDTTPAECSFTVDVYYNTCYSIDEILATIVLNTRCGISLREDISRPAELSRVHPFVQAGLSIGLETCVSPTSSACGWLQVPALKIGPGDPACTRCADERIAVLEIRRAINIYIKLLERSLSNLINKPERAA
ncbi:hypothetical protein BC343_21270 [Mucilaginibacter pedocola]|uniref:Peptidase M20 dimerisation domain-containing protein n=2 Tax=Mucilaginibacter pedocola TaxID=1792845 RepID=A0A1S9PJW8_9SPHI|nr:hypothetical protein BC343_21270 [Mucilaginibacter pedocola]